MSEIRITQAIQRLQEQFKELSKQEGPQGPVGPKGDRGERGLQGERGIDGRDGIDGVNGINGRDGKDGKDGTPGYTPQKGIDYRDGVDGINGADGVGIEKAEVREDHLYIKLTNGKEIDCGHVRGYPGASGVSIYIVKAEVNEHGHLIITLNTGKEIDAGYVGGSGGGAVASVNGKIGEVVLNYEDVGAAAEDHNHDDAYADINHNHDSDYSAIDHNHDSDYSAIDHTHSYNDLNDLPTLFSGNYNDLTNKPTIPPDVSNQVATNTNDIHQQNIELDEMHQKITDLTNNKANIADLATVATSGSYNDLVDTPTIPDVSNYYNKTESDERFYSINGGKIYGVPELWVDDEDYQVGIPLVARLDNNRGTILNVRGHADETNYYTAIENVADPVNNHDAVNLQTLNNKTSITWISAVYDEGQLIVASDAYQKCIDGVSTNHTVYLKITERGQISVLRCKAWINFNQSPGGDSFLFTDFAETDTNKTVTITQNGATFSTTQLEHMVNKVDQWQQTPDATHYPTERLVKYELDWLKAYVDDKWGGHLIWSANSWANGITYSSGKARSLSGNDWKLQNLDFSPYKRVRAWISGCKGTVQDQEGASFAVDVFLDDTMISQRSGIYIGTSVGYAPNDNGVKQGACIVIDASKTKCAMIYSNFNTTGTTALERDFKLVRLVGYKNDEV